MGHIGGLTKILLVGSFVGLTACSLSSKTNVPLNQEDRTEIVYMVSPDPSLPLTAYKMDEEARNIMAQVVHLQGQINLRNTGDSDLLPGQLLALYYMAANGNKYITREEATIAYTYFEKELRKPYEENIFPPAPVIPSLTSPTEPQQQPLQ
ncbi:MAG: hypothetical protein ABIH49_02950 [archaeon]